MWENTFLKTDRPKSQRNRAVHLFWGNQFGGTKNKILSSIRQEVSYLTDENLVEFQEKLQLKIFNSLLGRNLRDTNVDKLKKLIEELKIREKNLDPR